MSHMMIACSMLKDELSPLLPPDLPVIWMDRGLHERPAVLHAKLQETLDTLPPTVDRVLLAYGFCGNALEGIHCTQAELVLPLFDDCIAMLLQGERNARTIYFTAGWLQDDLYLGNAYHRDVAKYGAEKTRHIYEMMLASYESFTLLNTGAFDLGEARETLLACASTLNLPLQEEDGHTGVLSTLLATPPGDAYWTLACGETFTLAEFFRRKQSRA